MHTLSSSTITMLVLIPLIVWRLSFRLRRMVGRQRLSTFRPWITLVVFPVIILLLGLGAHAHPERIAWLAVGLGLGVLLGVIGLRKTRFEPTPQGLFYTPNVHIGITISLLFVARIIYRFVELSAIDPTTPPKAQDFGSSPVTLAIFGVLAGYYIAYAAGLVRWRSRVMRAKM